MSGTRRPLTSQQVWLAADYEIGDRQASSFVPPVTKTAEFDILPPDPPRRPTGTQPELPSHTPARTKDKLPDLAQRQQLTHRQQIPPEPNPLLLNDLLVYPAAIPQPRFSYDLRSSMTVGGAVVTAVAMVASVSIFGLQFGADPLVTATQSSDSFKSSAHSDNDDNGAPPIWAKGGVGVLGGGEIDQGDSNSASKFTARAASRPVRRKQIDLPSPDSPLSVSPIVDPEVTDVLATSNSNMADDSAKATGLKSIEPGESVEAAFYANCADATAAGVTPIHQGSPGYRLALDADNDDIACETVTSPTSTAVPAKPSATTQVLANTTIVQPPIERTTTTERSTTTERTTTETPTITRPVTTSALTTTPTVTTISTATPTTAGPAISSPTSPSVAISASETTSSDNGLAESGNVPFAASSGDVLASRISQIPLTIAGRL